MNANQTDGHSFKAEWLVLSPLETFDPIAFQCDETISQRVCNFVLALALVFDDLKDIVFAYVALQDYKQDGAPRNRAFGLYSGMNLHLLRLIMGTVHELLNLIQREEVVIQDATFRETVRLLPPDCRNAWTEVVNVALNKESTTTIGKVLIRVRNKVAFHYDPERIQSGYKRHFFGSKKEDSRAYLSRGRNMQGTRFYFADAAAYGFLRNEAGTRPEDMTMNLMGTVEHVSLSLRYIVTGFIQKRKCSFRPETES